MVSMTTQINLRLPEKILIAVQSYTNKHGFSSIQEMIKETIREKIFEPELRPEYIKRLKAIQKEGYGETFSSILQLRKKIESK